MRQTAKRSGPASVNPGEQLTGELIEATAETLSSLTIQENKGRKWVKEVEQALMLAEAEVQIAKKFRFKGVNPVLRDIKELAEQAPILAEQHEKAYRRISAREETLAFIDGRTPGEELRPAQESVSNDISEFVSKLEILAANIADLVSKNEVKRGGNPLLESLFPDSSDDSFHRPYGDDEMTY